MELKKYVSALALVTVLIACNKKDNVENADKEKTQTTTEISESVIKVYVAGDGKILADGQQTTLEKLDKDLVELAKDSGVVYFSRANAQGEGPIESMQVIESVMKYGVAIKFYTDSTFTQAVDMNGQSQ